MSISTRIILAVYSIIAAVISIGFCVISVFKNLYDFTVKYFGDYISYNKYGIIVSVAAGLFIFILSVFCFYISLKTNKDRKAVSKKTGIGEVRISIPALETISLSSVRKLDGIKDTRVTVKNAGDGVSIDMKVVLFADTVIPLLSEDIQTRVKEAVENSTGIKVYDVRVLVDNIHSNPVYKAKTGE
jgi:uncharacterized alkaline shock family protein YloU